MSRQQPDLCEALALGLSLRRNRLTLEKIARFSSSRIDSSLIQPAGSVLWGVPEGADFTLGFKRVGTEKSSGLGKTATGDMLMIASYLWVGCWGLLVDLATLYAYPTLLLR